MAISRPPASAYPWTWAMTGFGQSRIRQRGRDVGGEERPPLDGAVDAALDLLAEVVPCRERAAGAFQDDDPDRRVGDRGIERGHQGRDQRTRQRVQLGRPVEHDADAPRCGHRPDQGLVRLGHRVPPPGRRGRPPRSTPAGVAMTGFRSTSSRSGRAAPSRPSETSIARDRRAVGPGPAADPVEDPPAAEVVEHRHRDPRRDRRQPHGHVVEHLGEDPAEADQHDRPELGVAAEADDQLDPRRRPWAPRAGRGRRSRGGGRRRGSRAPRA